MKLVVAIESFALLSSLGALVWVFASKSKAKLTPGVLLLVFLMGVQALIHASDVLEWLAILDIDQMGDDLRVVIPLLWLLAIFALHRTAITGELNQEREQVKLFLEETPLAAVVFDTSGIILSASRDWAARSGCPGDSLAGRAIGSIPNAPQEVLKRVLAEAKNLSGRFESDKPMRATWGDRPEWIEWHGTVHPHRSGEGKRITLVLRLVTARVEVEFAKAVEARQMFETHRAELVGQLAATVAHDLNNFLHVISSNAELLPETSKEPDVAEARASILEASGIAANLVRSLTSLARAKGASEEVDLVDLVKATSSLIQRSMPRAILVQLDLPEAPVPIFGDRTRLQQALVNLIINARDAMPEGGLLRIVVADGGNVARISVHDNGTGIPMEVQQRIFDRFFTTKGASNGTGLGLPLVRSVVEEHHGAVEVDSTPNVGTIFRIVLPKKRGISPIFH